MIGQERAVVYNPTCDEKCPEDCKYPWKVFVYQRFFKNKSALDLVPLPKPQYVTEDWKIDGSFQITKGISKLSYNHYQISIKLLSC